MTGTATSVQVHWPEGMTTETTEDDTDASMLSDPTNESDQADIAQQAEGTRQPSPDAVRPKQEETI